MRSVLILAAVFSFTACQTRDGKKTETTQDPSEISDDSLMTLIQFQTFNYFWEGAEPVSGMARERLHMDGVYSENDQNVVTSGGSGFGLMAIVVGIERGFITRDQGIERFEKIVSYLENADSFHGVWPHWWDGRTGKVKKFSPKDNGGDLVESSFLAAGLISVRQYLNRDNQRESELASRINELWENIEFNWHTKGGENVLYWHWSPDFNWDMNFGVKGYNECLIMYVLAASSPKYAIDAEVYHQGWARDGAIADDTVYYGMRTILNHYGSDESTVGPLFWAHYSYLGLNPKELNDQYANYWELNTNHVKINYAYCLDNPNGFKGYGPYSWGLTSSYSMNGYSDHRPENDLGVISPTAALSSFPYTPNESMNMLRFLYTEADSLVGKYGPYDAYNMSEGWYLPRYLAIDQGPIPVMIENYRTGLIWNLFMSAPEIHQGLEKLGFAYE
jgi:hypothetical protein